MNDRQSFTLICAVALLLTSWVSLSAWSAQRCHEAIIELLGQRLSSEDETGTKRRLNHFLSKGVISLSVCRFNGEAKIVWRPNSLEESANIMYFKARINESSTWQRPKNDRFWRSLDSLTPSMLTYLRDR